MDCKLADTSLGGHMRSLSNRKQQFPKDDFLHNSVNHSRKASQPAKEHPKLHELISKDEIASLIPLVHQKLRAVGVGLENFGNTCFLNSALQSLIHTTPLCAYLMSQKHSRQCKVREKGNEFCALCSMERIVMRSRLQSKGGSAGSISPTEIVKNIRSLGKQFHPHRQEDCHEFMRCFIDAMHMGAIGFNKKLPREVQETSPIFRIFGGKLRSKVTCAECKRDSIISEPFLDLSLDLLKNSSKIGQCLGNFFRVEHLSSKNKYSCAFCKKLTEASKQFSVDSPPSVLTIQFKRFNKYMEKINRPIEFPEMLELGPFMSGTVDRKAKESCKYQLYAVIIHRGYDLYSGHYFAYVRGLDDNWYLANDESVTRTSLSKALSQNAYILLYQRVSMSHTVEKKATTKVTADVDSGHNKSLAISKADIDSVHSKSLVISKAPKEAMADIDNTHSKSLVTVKEAEEHSPSTDSKSPTDQERDQQVTPFRPTRKRRQFLKLARWIQYEKEAKVDLELSKIENMLAEFDCAKKFFNATGEREEAMVGQEERRKNGCDPQCGDGQTKKIKEKALKKLQDLSRAVSLMQRRLVQGPMDI